MMIWLDRVGIFELRSRKCDNAVRLASMTMKNIVAHPSIPFSAGEKKLLGRVGSTACAIVASSLCVHCQWQPVREGK